MDKKVDVESRDKQTSVELDDFLFIPFFNALEKDDHTITGVNITRDEFEDLSISFSVRMNSKMNNVENRIHKLRMKKMIVINACMLLHLKFSFDAIKILQDEGYQISEDTYSEDIKKILKSVKRIDSKIRQFKMMLPNKPKKIDNDISAYDMLVNISMGHEYGFDFEKCTVGAFFAYNEALKKKGERIKSMKDGK